MSIEEKRRAAFEAWLELAGFDVERFHCINGYRGNEQMAAWEAWNAALDSICVELPGPLPSEEPYACYEGGWNDARAEIQDVLTASGIRHK